jgi:HEAT repeat protein/energy-coupling factor transporter ATP-binding protein EcfA2
MTPQLDGVYVPLAIVERQKPKPQPRNQQEEKEKETEKLIPIAEERFFEDVLRQGKSDISQGRKIAIIGEPGAGKTTRLQKIADWILEQSLGLPIWIDLAELGAQSICEYLEKVWLRRCQGEVTRGDLEAQINRVWLLLDGVDEMTNTQGMQQLGKDLSRSWVQDSRVVVTCRVNVWEADKNAFSGFDVFRNLEFNAEQVTEYIRRWFAGMGDAATGESLEAELAESENSRLKELIQNPLRLWMLCQIWSSRDGTLPDTQAKLYASFIKYIYRWKEQFIKTYVNLCRKNEPECKRLLHEGLGELAKAAIDGKSGRFRLSYRLVSEYLGERSDETSLLSLALSLGWLNRVGIDFDEPEESVYAFYHATFQEYFAALAVEDWDYFLPRNHVDFPVVGKKYRIFEVQWKQVILLWLGREDIVDEEKEKFIEKLVNFDDGCGKWNFEKADRGFYEYRAYFLAAAGISEFKFYSIADAIVQQIVQWGLGYFSQEKQDWQKFIYSIENVARKTLSKTDSQRTIEKYSHLITLRDCPESTRIKASEWLSKIEPSNPKVIAEIANLIRIIETNEDEKTRKLAAYSLEKIGQGNLQAISELIRIIEFTENKLTLFWAAYSLEKIGQGNLQVISELVRILEYTENKLTCLWTAYSLGKIEQGNPQATSYLVKNIKTNENSYIEWAANYILMEIGQGNHQATSELIRIIESTENSSIRSRATCTLGEIGHGDPQAISAFLRVLETTQDENIYMKAALSLGKIEPGNHQAIAALVKVLENTEENSARRLVILSLPEIGHNNLQAIDALIKILETSDDQTICSDAADSLGEIGHGNPQAIAALVRVLENTEGSSSIVPSHAASSLGKMGQGNPQAIAALVRFLENTDDHHACVEAAYGLGKTVQFNRQAIAVLLKILKTTEHKHFQRVITAYLEEVLNTSEQQQAVISDIQPQINDETYKNKSDFFENCYKLLWNCAQNLPYPTFYQAWHHQLTTPHPEVPETTGVGSTPFTQSLNLADLPKILDARLVETQLIESLQLICIDTSKFIDTDNPALDIYGQFLDQNCPQRPNGEPETLSQLKSYWNRLRRDSDKHPILIFYQDPTSPAAQGLSPTFLNALTRFDGTICLITDSPHPPLQTFSPHDPDLLQSVVNWLKRVHLES